MAANWAWRYLSTEGVCAHGRTSPALCANCGAEQERARVLKALDLYLGDHYQGGAMGKFRAAIERGEVPA